MGVKGKELGIWPGRKSKLKRTPVTARSALVARSIGWILHRSGSPRGSFRRSRIRCSSPKYRLVS
ncbi:hypothetical protein AAMO2058_000968800 [Amorphochlora amoebiformis]